MIKIKKNKIEAKEISDFWIKDENFVNGSYDSGGEGIHEVGGHDGSDVGGNEDGG